MQIERLLWRRVAGLHRTAPTKKTRGATPEPRRPRSRRFTATPAIRLGRGTMEIGELYRPLQRHRKLFDTKNRPWTGGDDSWLDPLLLSVLRQYQGIFKSRTCKNSFLEEEINGLTAESKFLLKASLFECCELLMHPAL